MSNGYVQSLSDRVLSHGCHVLNEVELLTLLFGGGKSLETPVYELLKGVDFHLPSLARLAPAELCAYRGIGLSRALALECAWELSRRRQEAQLPARTAVHSSMDAFRVIRPNLMDLSHEEFWVILLNRSHHVITKRQVSRGGISGTVVDPRLIFKWAMEKLASAIIVAHNHPSGQLKPSRTDLRLTRKLIKAGELLEIPVLDHLILNGESYLSFSDEQLIPIDDHL
jgi:DNA repair protein RadC